MIMAETFDKIESQQISAALGATANDGGEGKNIQLKAVGNNSKNNRSYNRSTTCGKSQVLTTTTRFMRSPAARASASSAERFILIDAARSKVYKSKNKKKTKKTTLHFFALYGERRRRLWQP